MKISVKMKDGKAIINKIEGYAGGSISSKILTIVEGEVAYIEITPAVEIVGRKEKVKI